MQICFIGQNVLIKTSILLREDNVFHQHILFYNSNNRILESVQLSQSPAFDITENYVFCHQEFDGKYGFNTPATLLIGMVWSHTCPGPEMMVLKTPSPPKSIFFTPGTA